MERKEVSLCDGKYRFFRDERGVLVCLRHGEPWREFVGDKAVGALFMEVEDLREAAERGRTPPADDVCGCEESVRLRAEVERLRGALEETQENVERFAVLMVEDMTPGEWLFTPEDEKAAYLAEARRILAALRARTSPPAPVGTDEVVTVPRAGAMPLSSTPVPVLPPRRPHVVVEDAPSRDAAQASFRARAERVGEWPTSMLAVGTGEGRDAAERLERIHRDWGKTLQKLADTPLGPPPAPPALRAGMHCEWCEKPPTLRFHYQGTHVRYACAEHDWKTEKLMSLDGLRDWTREPVGEGEE